MNWSELLGLRVNAALSRGAARDIEATQRRIDKSDCAEVIVHALNKGKLKFRAKKAKLSKAVSDSLVM